MTPSSRLARVRAESRTRWTATALGALVGLTIAAFHWVGFFAGGALVGLVAPDLKRAVVAGAGFGLLAWLAFATWLALQGALATYLGTGQLLAVSVAIPVVAATIGSLARGLI